MDDYPRESDRGRSDAFLQIAASGPWPGFREGEDVSPEARAFLREFIADASFEEIGDLSSDDLAALAHDFWLWRGERGNGAQAARLRQGIGAGGRALDRDILEVVGPDMPFLVDSVMGELNEQGVAALAMFHPVAPAVRGAGRDSLIQVHLPRLSASRADALVASVRATLADVQAVVADFSALRRRMLDCAAELSHARLNAPVDEVNEAVALLRWLAGDRFTFLGARDYRFARGEDGALLTRAPDIARGSGLGLLRDPRRYVLRESAEPMVLTPELQRLLDEPAPLIVAKSTMQSRVHRRTAADYVGVKRYGADGEVVGETRFVGLFTSEAFTEPTREIPLLRRKIEWVVAQSGFAPDGHNAKTLRHVLETYPRGELWQSEREDLLQSAVGITHLLDRPRPCAFCRRDRFNRFVSALVFLPKDRFNSRLRTAVGERLAQAYGGRVEEFYPQLGEGPLARVHYIIGDIDKSLPDPNRRALDADIAALSRSWDDDFRNALAAYDALSPAERERVEQSFAAAFSTSYKDRYPVEEALIDAAHCVRMEEGHEVSARVYRLPHDAPDVMRCKLYSREDVLALSATIPIMENMGLFVEGEQNFELPLLDSEGEDGRCVYIHELDARAADGEDIDLEHVGPCFEEAFRAIWDGKAESDGFNRLILKLGAPWREAALIRALARFRQQTGLDPSQAVQERALAAHPNIAALLLALFRVRHDPTLPESIEERAEWAGQLQDQIKDALARVESLDDDRALRRIADLIGAVLRTNYYQDGAAKAFMSFKIDSKALADLPAPKPYREIWVAARHVEGVHLRMGAVARGGLRWSDRREDFRAEILDLVKAQQVKNAIIVPVGAKGGFYPKCLPARDAPDYRETAIEAYKTFLRGLLDITDNIVDAKVRPPKDVVRWDDDDPYLVVAADKGTAAFSDIANGVSAEYGFWLGDAFASGGSDGYDHKKMGITARGAWVAVQRHFRELGKDIQSEPFAVIGVGDMSGDVFGNGMLLSRKIKLIAAFDHRDIFLDPEPRDLDAAFEERKRLFEKPRSSWADYNKDLISEGGGIYSRALKSIALTPQIAALTGLEAEQVTPSELIHALLKSRCELLWFGGIGNYVKARIEPHAAVGDKANDAVRVNAEEIKAQVIGEGANLGVTQLGRIAFARTGGRINTDAIDNSAGVDTSDHEVNIKILLNEAMRGGELDPSRRDALLAEMTEDVAHLVLKHNYDQTRALSLAQARASAELDVHERLIARLENAGKLSRAVEQLPNAEEFAALRAERLGLTRPELSKLLAFAKIDLFDALAQSPLADDPMLCERLEDYFPERLAGFERARHAHRLRREIVSTSLADDIVNGCGPDFIDRMRERARVEPVCAARAFEAAGRIFDFDTLSARIDALDNRAPAEAQIALHLILKDAILSAAVDLARRMKDSETPLADWVARYREAVSAQRDLLRAVMSKTESARYEADCGGLREAGAPLELAREIAQLNALDAAFDVADLAAEQGWPIEAAGQLYRAVGELSGLDAIRAGAQDLQLGEYWDRVALHRALEEARESQRALASAAAKALAPPEADAAPGWAGFGVRNWIEALPAPARASLAALNEYGAHGPWNLSKLTLAAAEARSAAALAD